MSRDRTWLTALSAAVLGALVAVVVMPALTSGAGPVQVQTSTEPVGPSTVTIDPPATPTADNTPTFTFSLDEPGDAFFQCAIDDENDLVECDMSFTPAEGLDDGEHTFYVRGKLAGSEDPYGPIASVTFTVEGDVPEGCEPGDGTACNSTTCEATPCTLVVSNDITTGTVTTSSQGAQLFAEINGGDPFTCPLKKNVPTAEYSRDWLQVLALTSQRRPGSKTVTMSTLETSTKPVGEVKAATLMCFRAPYSFPARLGFARSFHDGQYHAFLPDCNYHLTTPCVVSVTVTAPSMTTRLSTVKVNLPPQKDNLDPGFRKR